MWFLVKPDGFCMVYGMRNCKGHTIRCLQWRNDVKTSLECEILPKNHQKEQKNHFSDDFWYGGFWWFLTVFEQNQWFLEKPRKPDVVFGMRQGFWHTLIHDNVLGRDLESSGTANSLTIWTPKNEIFKESHNFGQFLDEKCGFWLNQAVFAWFMAWEIVNTTQ